MDLLERTDETAFLWLNSWVGHFPWLDSVARAVVSDYLAPVLMSLVLLGLWFTGATADAREHNQRGVMAAILGLALANLATEIIDIFVFRPRPFDTLDVSLLFYRPTDSSFPANPAALGFAIATGVWLWNRRVGTVLLGVAVVFALSRVYAGVFYPLDVLGGAAIGAVASLLAAMLLQWVEPLPTKVLRIARAIYLA